MPAVRSFFTLSILATCLAQVMADGHLGGGEGQPGWSGQGQPGWSGEGGRGGGGGHDSGKDEWDKWQPTTHVAPQPIAQPTTIFHTVEKTVEKTIDKPITVTVTNTKEIPKEGEKVFVTQVHTTTVTAAAPCTSAATVHVTAWQYAPPGCWCDKGSPPPWQGAPTWPWPIGDAPVHTTVIPNFVQGRSSIPADQAVKTGVTVAAVPAPAPTGAPAGPPAGPPGGGFLTSRTA